MRYLGSLVLLVCCVWLALPCWAEAPPPSERFGEEITVRESVEDSSHHSADPQNRQGLGRQELERLPVQNAAEAAGRLSGIVLVRDKGEADGILVRGAESRLVSTTLDGERLPSPSGKRRTAGLGMVPSDLLEKIEVFKTFSPENDGDAIGGVVHLVTRGGLAIGNVDRFGLGAGFDSLGQGPLTDGNAAWGRRLADGRLGLFASLASSYARRGAEQIQRRFDEPSSGSPDLERFELRDFELERSRTGGLLNLDGSWTENTDFALRSFYNHFKEHETRRRVKSDLEGGSILRELKESVLDRQILSVKVATHSVLQKRYLLGGQLRYLSARESQPDRIDTSFEQEDVHFITQGAAVQALDEQIDLFELDEIGLEDNKTDEDNLVAALDVAAPIWIGAGDFLEFRGGLKFRRKRKTQDTTTHLFASDEPLLLRDFLDPGQLAEPMVDPDVARELISRFGLQGVLSLEEEAGDYRASETTAAAYGLAQVEVAPSLNLLAGLRYEWTQTDYKGFELISGEKRDGVSLPIREVRGRRDGGVVLPMASMALRLGESWTLRAGVARTLARPDYFDLVPFSLIDKEDSEILQGNASLRTTLAWNYDLALERRVGAGGHLDVSFFAKTLDDFIFLGRGVEDIDGEEFEVTRPENGKRARLHGFEVDFSQRLSSGAGWMSGFFYRLGFAHTSSSASLTQRPGKVRLPGQARISGTFGLGFDRGRIHTVLDASYADGFLRELGEEAGTDLFVDRQWRLSFAASWTLSSRWRISFQADNLGDSPSREYLGRRDLVTLRETVGRSVSVGLKWTL